MTLREARAEDTIIEEVDEDGGTLARAKDTNMIIVSDLPDYQEKMKAKFGDEWENMDSNYAVVPRPE